MTATRYALDRGDLKAGCATARRRTAPSWAPAPRSPRRCVPPPASTGCCWTSSTAAAARSRHATWSPPPRRTACRPSSAPSRPSASAPAGCSTSAPPGVMFPRIDAPTEARGRDSASALPAAGGPRRRDVQPHVPLRARPAPPRPRRRRRPRRRADRDRAPVDGRGDRRARRRRRAVRRPARPVLALGVPGDLTAPVYVAALERVLAAARAHGKAAGLLVPDGAAAATQRRRLAVPRHRVGHVLLAAAVSASCARPGQPA